MVLMSSDDLIGLYSEKPFSKYRRNISLLLDENKRKHTIHTLLELDVTDARKKIRQLKQKQNIDISFTGWIIKCVAQGVSEHKIFNSYRHGKRKIITFDDIDVPIPVERYTNDDVRPMAYILRKANRKTLQEITAEIRSIQQKAIEEKTQLLSEKLSFLERFVLNAPIFVQKFIIFVARRNAFLRKKHMGTVGVTAIGMKGRFPGWVIPLGGGSIATLFAVAGIVKKPGVVNDKIEIREYLHISVSFDHDIIDGGPLARFIQRFIELIESGFGISES